MSASSPGPEAGPAGSGPVPGGPASPGDGVPGISDALPLDRDDLDVLSLAGLAPPPEGDWLLVTSLDSQPAAGSPPSICTGTSCMPTAATCSSGWPLVPDPRGSRKSARRCGR